MPLIGFEPRVQRDPLVVTQSDVAAFTADRLSWALGSYCGLRPRDEPVYGPLRLGTRVHAALEQYYGYGRDLMGSYAAIAAAEIEGIRASGAVFDERAWARETELGRVMLEGYPEWLEETGADSQLDVISAEEKLTHVLDVDGTAVELRGKIDLRVFDRATKSNFVIDFKTTSAFDKLVSTAHLAPQLKFYMLLEKLVHAGDPDHHLGGAIYVMFLKSMRGVNSRPPYYDRCEVRHSTDALRTYFHQLHGTLSDYVRVVRALDAGEDWRRVVYPNVSHWTQYNDFRHVMSLMCEGNDARSAAMARDLFVQQDPHERYNVPPA